MQFRTKGLLWVFSTTCGRSLNIHFWHQVVYKLVQEWMAFITDVAVEPTQTWDLWRCRRLQHFRLNSKPNCRRCEMWKVGLFKGWEFLSKYGDSIKVLFTTLFFALEYANRNWLAHFSNPQRSHFSRRKTRVVDNTNFLSPLPNVGHTGATASVHPGGI